MLMYSYPSLFSRIIYKLIPAQFVNFRHDFLDKAAK